MNNNQSQLQFSSKKIPVTVLGATGVVGQRFLRRIANHPWFYPQFLAASDRSAGKKYAEACRWRSGLSYAGVCRGKSRPMFSRACIFSHCVFSSRCVPHARSSHCLQSVGAYVLECKRLQNGRRHSSPYSRAQPNTLN